MSQVSVSLAAESSFAISDPLVTAVIPTRNRPELLTRAVRSALTQTYAQMEVIVVVDGPDAVTIDQLAKLSDDRLRVITLPKSVGGAGARNAGVEAARGMWIALLDDDDEWLPVKIDLQMQRARNSRFRYPIVSTQLFARTSEYEVVWPRVTPYEPLSEYLLARNSWSFGEGLMQSTTLLFPKELFCQVPFRTGLRRHQDVDWVLRAAKHEGTGIEFISQPLAVWNLAERRSSVSSGTDWQISLEWINSVRDLITPRAYASFVLTELSSQAAKLHDWKAFPLLFKTMLGRGQPSFRDVLLCFGMWLAPRKLRRAVRTAHR
jgi:glycosyltransferase involved in cell wall biosynthesis